MDNYIDNINYFQLQLQKFISEFIEHLNDATKFGEDNINSRNFQLVQVGKDLYKIGFAKQQLQIEQYPYENRFQYSGAGIIQLLDSRSKNVDIQNYYNLHFEVIAKYQKLLLTFKNQKGIEDVFIGKFCFPESTLRLFSPQSEPGKISFAHQEVKTKKIFQQIEFHPSVPNVILFLLNGPEGQSFNIYSINKDEQTVMFYKKTDDLLLCSAINFDIDFYEQSNIYFTNISGHLFQINFGELIQLQERDANLETLYLSKKSQLLQYKQFQLQVYSQSINFKSHGSCIYFQKIPVKNQNLFLFFNDLKENLEIIIIRIDKSSFVIIFQQTIQLEIELQEQIFDFNQIKEYTQIQINPIKKYHQNQPSIDTLFFYCQDNMISIDISEQHCVNSCKLDDIDEESKKQACLILGAYPIDFCYFQFLILKLKKNDFQEFIQFKYEILEQPQLYVEDMYSRHSNTKYQQNKEILNIMRESLGEGIYEIKTSQIKNQQDYLN